MSKCTYNCCCGRCSASYCLSQSHLPNSVKLIIVALGQTNQCCWFSRLAMRLLIILLAMFFPRLPDSLLLPSVFRRGCRLFSVYVFDFTSSFITALFFCGVLDRSVSVTRIADWLSSFIFTWPPRLLELLPAGLFWLSSNSSSYIYFVMYWVRAPFSTLSF